jgi:hypothetical protein
MSAPVGAQSASGLLALLNALKKVGPKHIIRVEKEQHFINGIYPTTTYANMIQVILEL